MGDRIVKGQGRTQVRLEALDTGNGICLCLTGGEAPHVGGVVLAAPRPSLTGQGNSCDLWTATVPGHKDVYLAQNCRSMSQPLWESTLTGPRNKNWK